MNTNKIKLTILEYSRLIRPQSAAHTGVFPLLAALIMNERNLLSLFILFFIGVFGHIHGYVLNDYTDIELDRQVTELKKKPLVKGIIPKSHAVFVIIFTLICSYVLAIIFFFSVIPLILLTFSAIFSGIYNLYGKKFPGSDFVLATSMVLLYFFGASTVSFQFTTVLYIVASLLFVEAVFASVVEGGIKDADHDFLGNVKTIVTVMGVKVKDNKLHLTTPFTIFAIIFRILYFGLIILLGFQPEINMWNSKNIILLTIVIIFIVLIILSFYKIMSLNHKTYDRSKIKKIYAGITIVTIGLIFAMLYPIFGTIITLSLLMLPLTWYTVLNTILFGKALQPWS
jgi:4-hydroxybenzoate polyprenyltransferase